VHVVEQGGEIGAADLLQAYFVGHSNQMFAIDIDLESRRFADVYMCVNNH
jgi:hypothetical protein